MGFLFRMILILSVEETAEAPPRWVWRVLLRRAIGVASGRAGRERESVGLRLERRVSVMRCCEDESVGAVLAVVVEREVGGGRGIEGCGGEESFGSVY